MCRVVVFIFALYAVVLSGCATDAEYYGPRDPSRPTVNEYMEGNQDEALEETAGRDMFDN